MAYPVADHLLRLWREEPRNKSVQWSGVHEAAALFVTFTLIFSSKSVSKAFLLSFYPGITSSSFQRAVDYLCVSYSPTTKAYIREASTKYAGTLPKSSRSKRPTTSFDPSSITTSGPSSAGLPHASTLAENEDNEAQEEHFTLAPPPSSHSLRQDLQSRKIYTMVCAFHSLFSSCDES